MYTCALTSSTANARSMIEAYAEYFSRRLYISGIKRLVHTSPRPAHSSVKHNELYNPHTDPHATPCKTRTHLDTNTSSLYAPRGLSANHIEVDEGRVVVTSSKSFLAVVSELG